jgi:hypothetical protein
MGIPVSRVDDRMGVAIKKPTRSRLNASLMSRQGLDKARIAAIEDEHARLTSTKERFRYADDTSTMTELVERVQSHEFELQRLWGFPQDAARHSHWYRVEGCTCNASLNAIVGHRPFRIVSDDCHLHAGRDVPGVSVLRSSQFEEWMRGDDAHASWPILGFPLLDLGQ